MAWFCRLNLVTEPALALISTPAMVLPARRLVVMAKSWTALASTPRPVLPKMSQLMKSMADGRVVAVEANSQPMTLPENQQLVNLTRCTKPVLANLTLDAGEVSKKTLTK